MLTWDVIAKFLLVFLMGFIPIAEVRGAIPFAYKFFVIDAKSYTLFSISCIIGILANLLIAPIILYALDKIEMVILGNRCMPRIIRSLYVKVISYVRNKTKRYESIEALGLAIFVAVPLPFTGAWTGSLIAYMLGLDKKKSLISIEAGVICASLIVLLAILIFTSILKIFGIEI